MGKNLAVVGIEEYRGKLRLRLPRRVADGANRYISTGLEATEENRRKVQIVAWEIEVAIKDGNDIHLGQYKAKFAPLPSPRVVTIPEQAATRYEYNLRKLWAGFTEFKRPQLAETTVESGYTRWANHIEGLPVKDVREAVTVRDYLLGENTANTAKRAITHINACCKWAVKSGKIPDNPFEGMAEDIRVIVPGEGEIDPFTREERDAILAAFLCHPKHRHYHNYVKFLFLSGCRIGEAVALQWRHIARDCGVVTIAESYDNQLKIRKDTKTHKIRRLPCNESLRELLQDIRPMNPAPDDNIFPAPRGGILNAEKFCSQVWRGCRSGDKHYQGILPELIATEQVERYRPPYNCRHTAITLWVDKGVPVPTVAKWVGNSPEIIFRHYAGVNNNLIPPEYD